ncbi:MAG: amidohydrolase family protein [Proteobacteria bacterium]|nr:amidohydrolase family protein [Pseudomonadota bacterium]
MKTLIEDATIVAFKDGRHTTMNNAVLMFEDDAIRYVGDAYAGDVDHKIDGRGKLVLPGFVNTHVHVTDTAFTRGWMEDWTGHGTNVTGLYQVLPAVRGAIGAQDEFAGAECGFAELLLSGCTTVVELGFDFEMLEGGDIAHTRKIADIAGAMGLRCYVGPRYRSGRWSLGNNGKVQYHWYPDRGRSRMDDCIKFCREYDGRFNGRLKTMLAPGQVDTCEPDMLRETRTRANESGLSIQLHAGQSPTEYRSIKERHGCTTIEYLNDAGLLGRDFIIGHGMFLSDDGDVDRCSAKELSILQESGTSIAHLPWVKARQGSFMNSFAKYRAAGINMCLGTDTYPFDMVAEMRCAATLCKIAEKRTAVGSAEDIFAAATSAGALALGRPDLGRLAEGCKADIVLMDITRPHAVPMRDPLKFVVFSASASDVDTVIVDGQTIVENRTIKTMDLPAALSRLNEASRRVWARVHL